jgi:hypothetical protein
MKLEQLRELVSHISINVLGTEFKVLVENDKKGGDRKYVQLTFESPDTITGEMTKWTSRKWYLSEYMAEDEIVKTCFAAIKQCVEHEVMEGFKFDGTIVFNPHVNFRALLEVADQIVGRE